MKAITTMNASRCRITGSQSAARSTPFVRFGPRALGTYTALAASALVGFGFVGAYEYAAGHGLLGTRAEQKYATQQGGLGVIVGGVAAWLNQSAWRRTARKLPGGEGVDANGPVHAVDWGAGAQLSALAVASTSGATGEGAVADAGA